MTDHPVELIQSTSKIEPNSIHQIFQSTKNSTRFYILSAWGNRSNFDEFMKKSLEETFLKPCLPYLQTDPFMNRFELNRIYHIDSQKQSKYYKLSKSTVSSFEDFIVRYAEKYTLESFQSEMAESVQVFSDFKIKETITFFSGWNSLDEIYEWQKQNPPNTVLAKNDTGTLYSPDEYDIMKSLSFSM